MHMYMSHDCMHMLHVMCVVLFPRRHPNGPPSSLRKSTENVNISKYMTESTYILFLSTEARFGNLPRLASRPWLPLHVRLLRCSRLDPPAAFARPAARNATRWLQVQGGVAVCSSPLSSWRCSGTVPTARKIAQAY